MALGELKKIILVDDQIANLTVGRNALCGVYNVFTVPSGEKLFLLLQKLIPDMILLDVEMPDMNGYEVIKIIKRNPETAHVPVIFLTSKNDTGSELEGLSLGAVDYISKPFSPPLLLKRIEVHLLVEEQKSELKNYNDNLEEMVRLKTETILDLQNAVLEIVADLVESRDNTTGGHIARTQSYLRVLVDGILAQDLYRDEVLSWNIDLLVLSAQLHDVGKIAVSDSILCKPGRLTPEEFEIMKTHTVIGKKIIERIQDRTSEHMFLDYAKILAVSHHEKWDGSGYPYGLKGTDIPLQGRIMALVDVYDALVSQRPYKPPFSHVEAVKIIADGGGTQFDPVLIGVFLSVSEKLGKLANKLSAASLARDSCNDGHFE